MKFFFQFLQLPLFLLVHHLLIRFPPLLVLQDLNIAQIVLCNGHIALLLFDADLNPVSYTHLLEPAIEILHGDLCETERFFPAHSVDVVTCNPPYMKAPAGLKNRDASVTASRHEICCTFADVARAASRLLRSKGRFYLVHRPARLVQIFEELRREKLEPKRLRLVHPFRDREPSMVLVEAVREAGEELRTAPPLIIYERPGQYTREIYEI